MARRDEGAYCRYVTEEQRSQPGCIGCEGDRLGDLLPSGLLERRRKAMLGGDAGFCMEAGEDLATGGANQPLPADTDPVTIPERSILFFQQQEPPISIEACCQSSRVQVHERQQGEGLGHLTHGMLSQHTTREARPIGHPSSPFLLLPFPRNRGRFPVSWVP